jgi:hypothetical protein
MSEIQGYYDEFKIKPNKTQIGLLFCNGKADEEQGLYNLSLFCNGSSDYTYYMTLNRTDSLTVIFYDLLQPLPIDPVASSLKVIFLLNKDPHRQRNSKPHLKWKNQSIPTPKNEYDSQSVPNRSKSIYQGL